MVCLSIAFAATGCRSTYDRPSWIDHVQNDNSSELAATSCATWKGTIEDTVAAAADDARAQLAASIAVEIESEVISEIAEDKLGSSSTNSESFRRFTTSRTSRKLSGVSITHRWQDANDGSYWVRCSIPRSEVEKQLAEDRALWLNRRRMRIGILTTCATADASVLEKAIQCSLAEHQYQIVILGPDEKANLPPSNRAELSRAAANLGISHVVVAAIDMRDSQTDQEGIHYVRAHADVQLISTSANEVLATAVVNDCRGFGATMAGACQYAIREMSPGVAEALARNLDRYWEHQ